MMDVIVLAATAVLKWQLALTLATVCGLVWFHAWLRWRLPIPAAAMRAGQHLLLLVTLSAPIVASLAPTPMEIRPAVQVGSGEVLSSNHDAFASPMVLSISTSVHPEDLAWQTNALFVVFFSLLALTGVGFAFRVMRLMHDKKNLEKSIRASFLWRSIGNVRLFLSAEARTPYSVRMKGRACIVLPQALLSDVRTLRIAVAHEAQHHRQGDFAWLSIFELVHLLSAWNPLARAWLGRLEDLHELACDEALLGQRGINNQAYARCLFDVARMAIGEDACFAGTARMAATSSLLKRRVLMMLDTQPRRSRWLAAAFAAILSATIVTAAWAGDSLIADRRVSEAQALELARSSQPTNGIPVVVNKQVLKWLNKAAGNPRGRAYMRKVLKRMKTYEPMIRTKLQDANMPIDLLAVPAMESGFQNEVESVHSAGLWQFIASTARIFGLRVDKEVDERTDPTKATDAAIAYFKKLQGIFNDWELSLIAYNFGEQNLQKAIEKAGHRDAFRLIDEGVLKKESSEYLPRMMAAILILRNPDLVKN